MPGALRRSTQTLKMINDPVYANEIVTPGRISKPELNSLYAQCKLFIHLGTVGQNDRSVLEAFERSLEMKT